MAGNQTAKTKGIVDIVFLIDVSGSMQGCIDGLKDNIKTFITSMTETGANNGSVVKDWRAKVVGFRDYEEDGADSWMEDNVFVRDAGILKSQLEQLKASGGGDEPETLLDAIYLMANMGETGKTEEESPYKWRYIRNAARVLIIFTDAPFKPKMFIPQAAGGNVDDIITLIQNKRLILSIFAPDLPCYMDQLQQADKSEFIPTGGAGLDEITKDPAAFNETMKQLAASVSQSAAVIDL